MKSNLTLALAISLLAGCATTAPATPATTTPAPEAPLSTTPPKLKVPGDVVPQKYALELTVLPEAETASGTVRIEVEVLKPTRLIWLNGTDLKVKKATVGGGDAEVIIGDEDFIGLNTKYPTPAGKTTLVLEFTAGIDHTRSRGLYAEKEGSESYAYTFFEPIDARRAFPCFDEPSPKVPWELTLHVKRSHVALANAPVVSETDEDEGMKKVVFEPTVPLPSYLVAFVVGPFEVVDGGTASGVPIRFVIPQGRSAELGWAKSITGKMLDKEIAYFGAGYPFKKLDVAVVPRFWGTMEHPGLVALGQPLTLISKDQETRRRKQEYLNIAAHEVGHYWFGDWVTTQWWDDVWLNEAMGEWFDLKITDQVMPEWQVTDNRVGISASAMDADELLSTQPIRAKVETKEAIAASFDGDITYSKGASVLRMFEAAVGVPKWQAFIRRYLQDHAYGNATEKDLVKGMRRELGDATADGFVSFLDKPGVPVVSAQLECKSTPTLLLSQKRSLPAGVTEPGTPATWPVPVCVRYGDGKKSSKGCVQLSTTAAATTALALEGGCPTWMILNADAYGYYRSKLTVKEVRAMFEPNAPVQQAKPTVAERLMTLSDFKASVKRGEAGQVDSLELAPLVVKDPNDKVAGVSLWMAQVNGKELTEPQWTQAKKYLLNTFGATAKKLTWKAGANDSDDRKQLRQQMLAVALRAGEPAISKEGARLADLWLEKPAASGLDDDLANVALEAGAKVGDAKRFDRYLDAAKKATVRTDKARLLNAIGEFEDPKLVDRALGLVLGADFDIRESWTVPLVLMSKRQTREQAWKWLQAHLDEMLAKMRSDESGWLFGAIAGSFCDPEHRKQVDALLTPRAAKIDGAQAAVSRGLDESDQCIAQWDRNKAALEKFLDAVR